LGLRLWQFMNRNLIFPLDHTSLFRNFKCQGSNDKTEFSKFGLRHLTLIHPL
jgi:hypothetical protein